MSFKNIRIKKRGGGTRLQRVRVLKSGKFRFVKNLKKTVKRATTRKTKTTKRRKSNPKRGNRKMGRRGFNVNKIFSVAKVGAFILPAAIFGTQAASNQDKLNDISKAYTGFSTTERNWQPGRMVVGYGPFVGVNVAQKVVQVVNRFLRSLF